MTRRQYITCRTADTEEKSGLWCSRTRKYRHTLCNAAGFTAVACPSSNGVPGCRQLRAGSRSRHQRHKKLLKETADSQPAAPYNNHDRSHPSTKTIVSAWSCVLGARVAAAAAATATSQADVEEVANEAQASQCIGPGRSTENGVLD
mmetsp:Transcript_40695/g.61505  ORF Transcript_40695/g.61505 Transcript_40695/m.61505 type:complete len:147 (-) Transcript_40695:349-789(-)